MNKLRFNVEWDKKEKQHKHLKPKSFHPFQQVLLKTKNQQGSDSVINKSIIVTDSIQKNEWINLVYPLNDSNDKFINIGADVQPYKFDIIKSPYDSV